MQILIKFRSKLKRFNQLGIIQLHMLPLKHNTKNLFIILIQNSNFRS